MNWKKLHDSYLIETPEGNKLLVSQGINNKWFFSVNIGEKVWSSDPVKEPYETSDKAKMWAENVYRCALAQ